MALAVLVLCFVVSAIVGSMGQSFSVFLLPISQTLQLERGEIASVYSMSLLASGLASPLVGLLFDRLGPRIVYAAGASVAAAGYALGSGADSLLEIGLLYGGLAGIGGALTGGVPHAALVSRWFRENAGTAMGIVFSAGGLATALTSPVSQVLIDALGWRSTFGLYAIVIGCIVPVVLLMPWRQIMAGAAGAGARSACVDHRLCHAHAKLLGPLLRLFLHGRMHHGFGRPYGELSHRCRI
ncbi:MAG TPA: MFS transporter [Micropepsaceae bacterium]|nr:MFS transporter [Micropepsaceae bacterium]